LTIQEEGQVTQQKQLLEKRQEDSLETIFRRMGEPSWLILQALDSSRALPGIEIIRRVERLLHDVDYPFTRLDPSTLHYALKRMEEDGLVKCEGRREVDVPGPRGTTRRETRSVYKIMGLGTQALSRRARLVEASHRLSLASGWST
jgi:DNA-binding PadR family transcriptional regulator